jgi:hypothetical protein
MTVKTCKVKCNDTGLSVTPFKLKLVYDKKSGPDDEGQWQSDDASMTVDFGSVANSPWSFASKNVPRGSGGTGGTNFGAPNHVKGKFKYTLTVKVPGQPPLTIDPQVEVDSGPPPNRGKKAAKTR